MIVIAFPWGFLAWIPGLGRSELCWLFLLDAVIGLPSARFHVI
jgi:hypothetical protein